MPGGQVGFTFYTKQRDDRYDLNQLRTEPWMPNQDEKWVIKMSWSIVSKAAERSSRQRHDIFCDPRVVGKYRIQMESNGIL